MLMARLFLPSVLLLPSLLLLRLLVLVLVLSLMCACECKHLQKNLVPNGTITCDLISLGLCRL